MDFFDRRRYGRSMPKAAAVLDPIACCTPVRAEMVDEPTAETLRSGHSPPCQTRSAFGC